MNGIHREISSITDHIMNESANAVLDYSHLFRVYTLGHLTQTKHTHTYIICLSLTEIKSNECHMREIHIP